LPLLPDARKLFHAVQHLNSIIVTGCPLGGWADEQKHRWAAGPLSRHAHDHLHGAREANAHETR